MTASAIAEHQKTLAGFRRVRLEGPITAAEAPRVRAMLQESATLDDPRLLVDLEGVTVLDASGVAALLEGRRAVGARPHGVMVLRLNRIVRRALKESGSISAFQLWHGAGM
jgi:anti-anti-sigma factor